MAKHKNKKSKSKSPTRAKDTTPDRRVEPPFTVESERDLEGRTLNELIALIKASPDWIEHVNALCSSKTYLILCGTESYLSYRVPKELEGRYIHLLLTEQLKPTMNKLALRSVDLLPNVVNWWICYHPSLNDFFPLLVKLFLAKERTFNMFYFWQGQIAAQMSLNWWRTIHSMKGSLKILFLNNFGPLPSFFMQQALSRIKIVRIEDFSTDMLHLYKQLGEKLEILTLVIKAKFECNLEEMERFLKSKPKFGRNLTRFHLVYLPTGNSYNAEHQVKLLQLFVAYFTKLEVLYIPSLFRIPLPEMFRLMAKLPNLREVTLSIPYPDIPQDVIDSVPPNTRITKLYLTFPLGPEFTPAVVKSKIAKLFPNLEWIQADVLEDSLKGELEPVMKDIFPRLKQFIVSTMVLGAVPAAEGVIPQMDDPGTWPYYTQGTIEF